MFRCRKYLRAHLATLVDHEEERQPLQFIGQFRLLFRQSPRARDIEAKSKGPVNCAALDVEGRSSRRRHHPDRIVVVGQLQKNGLCRHSTHIIDQSMNGFYHFYHLHICLLVRWTGACRSMQMQATSLASAYHSRTYLCSTIPYIQYHRYIVCTRAHS